MALAGVPLAAAAAVASRPVAALQGPQFLWWSVDEADGGGGLLVPSALEREFLEMRDLTEKQIAQIVRIPDRLLDGSHAETMRWTR
jgi:hypothetical protein